MTEPNTKKRKSVPTQELFEQVMKKLDRMDERLTAIETEQTLTRAAWQRQGRVIEEVNTRCMEKLGIQCPLLYEDDVEDGTNGGVKG